MNPTPSSSEVDLLRSQAACLEQLLEVQEQTVIEQTQRLEGVLRELESERELLSANEAHTRSIIESALDAVITVDAGGMITGWNHQAERMFGWSGQEAMGRRMEELICPERHRELHRHGMSSDGRANDRQILRQRIETEALHRDGHEFPVEVSVSSAGTGKAKRFIAFLRDISERRQAQEGLQRARDEAVAANRLKSEFLATMSHEVRTPMNGVLGMVELLLSTELSVEQRDYIQTVYGCAESLLTILNDVLDYSRIEAGRLILESIPFDMNRLVEEVGELFAVRSAEKGLELIVRYAPEAPVGFIGDPGRIRQALINLVGNAIKFTEAGHILVDVECEQQSESAAHVRIQVQDTGIGIPEAKLERIFEKFTQADASTTRKFGGTGLGLAICKRLMELMGGSVGVESRVGEGSTFWLRLDLAHSNEIPLPLLPNFTSTHLHALIVDDNAVNRRVLREQLMKLGITSIGVAGGESGLDALREASRAGRPFHIGLIDYHMPGMDGEALAKIVKADPALRTMPLVVLTSSTGQGEMTRLLQAGFDTALVKPVRMSQLARTLTSNCGSTEHAEGRRAPAKTSGVLKAAGTGASGSSGGYRPRILVAEDNRVNQKIVARMLEKLNFVAEVAANGREAVRMFEAAEYDLVLMDCQMPEMDGFEGAEAIRKCEAGGHIPIIALTASAMQGDRERCLAAGMDDYLSKPLKGSELVAALKKWLPAPILVRG